ncbi:MAG: bifunctional DNA-formamidopyrimidine glycosylase/DNA-(apurinic or apyrimidinic site) lyase [Thermoleophilia bacterium]|nr:bifunctional DNA-formamidopyrimidine glycosylase/DNA-(apurinic or apyrimidinic site) lyase [Thermoleophilia bacterium]
MPELPEVETVRRQLSRRIPGRMILRVEVHDPLCVAPADPEELRVLEGREVRRVARRGKHLLIHLDDGAALVVHLRMTGRLLWHAPGRADDADRFLRAVVALDDGSRLAFADQRRFGRLRVLPAGGDPEAFWRGRVGAEPLGAGFDNAALARALRGRSTPVKAALLNQALVAGVGNIYADEALFRARIHPLTDAGALGPRRVAALREAIVDVLEQGVATGGASIRDYADAEGARGGMQDVLRVHLREGEPCVRCGAVIRKLRVAQRGTYVCPACQRRGR